MGRLLSKSSTHTEFLVIDLSTPSLFGLERVSMQKKISCVKSFRIRELKVIILGEDFAVVKFWKSPSNFNIENHSIEQVQGGRRRDLQRSSGKSPST